MDGEALQAHGGPQLGENPNQGGSRGGIGVEEVHRLPELVDAEQLQGSQGASPPPGERRDSYGFVARSQGEHLEAVSIAQRLRTCLGPDVLLDRAAGLPRQTIPGVRKLIEIFELDDPMLMLRGFAIGMRRDHCLLRLPPTRGRCQGARYAWR